MLGDGRVQLQCYDGVARLGLIRGTMKRRVWISPVRSPVLMHNNHLLQCDCIYVQGDIVLVGLREFQMEKSDIIHKYSADEARSLQAYGELPVSAKINQTAIDMALVGGEGQEEDMGFDFEEVSVQVFFKPFQYASFFVF